MTSLRRLMFAKAASGGSGGGWRTATGAVASFIATRSTALPMEFDLVPIQAGTDDPSPDNVRPITGHDGFTRNGAGINLLNPDFNLYSVKFAYLVNNHVVPEGATARMTITNKDTSIDASGCYLGFIESSYTGGGSPTHFNWCINKGSISSNLSNIHQGVACCGVFLYPNTQETFDKLFSRYNIMVELGTVAHDFEPYTGHSYTTTFPTPPGTVYGGHVRDNGDGTGTLVVTNKILDLGTLTYSKSSYATNGFVATGGMPSDFPLAPSTQIVPNWKCSQYSIYSNVGIEQPGVVEGIAWRVSAQNKGVIIRDYQYADYYTNNDMASFKSAMSGVQLVYELATPVVYTLTLTALQSLIGQNHVWVDNADSVTVEYWGH